MLSLLFAVSIITCYGFTKVVVPAVYKEWHEKIPDWMNETFKLKYNFTTFLYQKLYPDQPNYIVMNRGCENGAYYRYIIDHYYNFPDVAIFVHANPHHHRDNWLDLVGCISPNATYMSLNSQSYCRESFNGLWAKYAIWLEQCMRDTLRIIWNVNGTITFNDLLPVNKPIRMCVCVSQQFFISRDMIHKRPLSTWEKLFQILANQTQCHAGDPDYENLYAFNRSSRLEVGPEPPDLGGFEKWRSEHVQSDVGNGRYTQAITSEHLSHLIFGHHQLVLPKYTMEDLCRNYVPNCPGSPCVLP